MKSNANQARELRSSLAPCSLLGFKDPTFFLVGQQVRSYPLQHYPQKPPKSTKLIEFYENQHNFMESMKIKPGSSDPALLLAPCSLLGLSLKAG